MSESIYAVAAYIARYWFAALAVVIVWRGIIWMRKDADRVSRAQRNLPDAGYIGEWAVVASDVPTTPEGLVLRAPRDGWIGSARACDVRLKDAGVSAHAARFFLREDGLHVQPQHSGEMLVDGEPVQREAVLRHGATLTIGGVTLQLRLFAGVVLSGEGGAFRRRKGIFRRAEPEMPDDDDEIVDIETLLASPQDADEDDADEDDFTYIEEMDEEQEEEYERTELPRPALTVRRRRSGRH